MIHSKQPKCRQSPNEERRAVATVELAVCLPVIVLLLFGSMQACDMIYLRHSITTAAYEGSLEASRPDATTASVKARVDQVLGFRGVKEGTAKLNSAGADISETPLGDPITVSVTAPVRSNLMLSGFFLLPSNISVDFSCTR